MKRRAFLVAGDQEGEGALRLAVRDDLGHGRDPGGDPALHVHRAASVQDAVPDLGGEGLRRPLLGRSSRHHVRMAGEAQIGRGGSAPRIQVLDPRMDPFAPRPFKRQPATGEAQARQMALQHVHGPLVGGGDGRNTDQVAGQFDRIDHRS